MTAPAKPPLVNQPSVRPTPKVVAATSTGLATGVVLWVAQRLGLELSVEAAEGLVLGAASLAGYLKRDRATGRHAA